MNIVFMGTPDFAVPSLKRLIKDHNVVAVFTQPDRSKGRGNKVTTSPVKDVALQYNIPIFQPEKLKSDIETINSIKVLKPDFIIVVAYGQILSKEVLDIPAYGCINLHASLLPKFRGSAPINWAIINGEKVSGNTTMLMDVGIDTGDMLLTSSFSISEEMTAGELHDLLMEDGAELLSKTIDGVINNSIVPIKQDDSISNYAPMFDKNNVRINWKDSNTKITNMIRGLVPKPCAVTNYNDITIKILASKAMDSTTNSAPGLILGVDNNGIEVSCGDGTVLITRLQFPGKKPMDVAEYIRGNIIEKGVVLQ